MASARRPRPRESTTRASRKTAKRVPVRCTAPCNTAGPVSGRQRRHRSSDPPPRSSRPDAQRAVRADVAAARRYSRTDRRLCTPPPFAAGNRPSEIPSGRIRSRDHRRFLHFRTEYSLMNIIVTNVY